MQIPRDAESSISSQHAEFGPFPVMPWGGSPSKCNRRSPERPTPPIRWTDRATHRAADWPTGKLADLPADRPTTDRAPDRPPGRLTSRPTDPPDRPTGKSAGRPTDNRPTDELQPPDCLTNPPDRPTACPTPPAHPPARPTLRRPPCSIDPQQALRTERATHAWVRRWAQMGASRRAAEGTALGRQGGDEPQSTRMAHLAILCFADAYGVGHCRCRCHAAYATAVIFVWRIIAIEAGASRRHGHRASQSCPVEARSPRGAGCAYELAATQTRSELRAGEGRRRAKPKTSGGRAPTRARRAAANGRASQRTPDCGSKRTGREAAGVASACSARMRIR